MVSWIVEETKSNNMTYIYILLAILVFMDIIACLHYIYLLKDKGNEKKSKKKQKATK